MNRKILSIDKNIYTNITDKLKCDVSDIKNIQFIKLGLTNVTFKFTVNNTSYVYRHPGENTKLYINRQSEVYTEMIAKRLGLDNTIIWIDISGWKLSHFIENSSAVNPYDKADQKRAMKLIKKLHDANVVSLYDFDYIKEANKFIKIFEKEGIVDFSKYESIHEDMVKINRKIGRLGYKKVLCHNDFWMWNILKDKQNKLYLIDWEYSGNAYPASDVAYFTCNINCSNDDYLELAKLYEGHELSDKDKYYYNGVMAIIMWYWYIWALYKEAKGKKIDDKDMWYDKAITALNIVKGY